MAHFAELDENNIVTRVIVVDDENCLDNDDNESEAIGIKWCGKFFVGGTWIQTSFNTSAGKHYLPEEDEDGLKVLDESKAPLRKNYAGKGHFYDSTRDAFYEPKPAGSWTLNEETCRWEQS